MTIAKSVCAITSLLLSGGVIVVSGCSDASEPNGSSADGGARSDESAPSTDGTTGSGGGGATDASPGSGGSTLSTEGNGLAEVEVDAYPTVPVVIGDVDVEVALGDVFGDDEYNLARAVVDGPQEATLGFAAFSFLTGDQCMDTFFPPGKVGDMFGFQATRDNDATGLGHNTSFTTIIASNVLPILNDAQKQALVTMAVGQVDAINDYAYGRLSLIEAFRRLDAGDGMLSEQAVMSFSGELYRLDGEINLERATVLGGIIASFSAEQRAAMDVLAAKNGVGTWPKLEEDKSLTKEYGHDVSIAVTTYIGQLFTWYAGGLARDAYFAPEREGAYFGAFYLKDAPAMGNPDYSIDTELTGGGGRIFLDEILDEEQAAPLRALVDVQRDWVEGSAVVRYAMALELRKFMYGETPDTDDFLGMATLYGKLDGLMAYNYAARFAEVGDTLSTNQMQTMQDMRLEMMGDEVYECDGFYLYSQNLQPWPEYSVSTYYEDPTPLFETE